MTKELLEQVANMELRDQLEAKEQMIKKLKKQVEIAKDCFKEVSDAIDTYFEKDGRSMSFTQDVLIGCGLSVNQAIHDMENVKR